MPNSSTRCRGSHHPRTSCAGAPRRDIAAEMADRIATALENAAGTLPWRPRWVQGRPGLPRNGLSGRSYSGINLVLLLMAQTARGWADPRWYTFAGAKQAAGYRWATDPRTGRDGWVWPGPGPDPRAGVRKGEKATQVVLFKPGRPRADEHGAPERDERGNLRRRLFMTAFSLFNAAQIDGLPAEAAAAPVALWERLEAAEAVFAASGIRTVENPFEGPHYNRATDLVNMPPRTAWAEPEHYYATRLHEYVHATGAAHRLARTFGQLFGDEAYAREELVAELGAAALCAHLGIVGAEIDQTAYIGHWIRMLREEPQFLFSVSADARRAAEFLGVGSEEDGQREEEEEEHDADAMATLAHA